MLLLSHTSFRDGITKQCSGNSIVGRSLGVSGDTYTSQLSVVASSNLIGRTVECAYSRTGTTVTPIDSATVDLTG